MKKILLYIPILFLSAFMSCESDDLKEQATVTFYPNLFLEISESSIVEGASYTMSMETSRVLKKDTRIQLEVEGSAIYGLNYTTNPPVLANNEIIVTIPAGENMAHIAFMPMNDGIVTPELDAKFTIEGADDAVKSIGSETFTIKIVDDGVVTDAGDCTYAGGGEVIAEFDFEGCADFAIPDGGQEAIVEGFKTDRGWGCRPFGRDGTTGLQASSFGGAQGEDNAWFIVGPFDASTYSQIQINFWVESFFGGEGVLNVWYSDNYNGDDRSYPDPLDGAQWSLLEKAANDLPAAGSQSFTEVTTVPCDMNGTEVYVGFQYVGGLSSGSASWTLDDLTISGIK